MGIFIWILAFFLFIVGFTLAVAKGARFVGGLVGTMARRNHKATEYIYETGHVPPDWIPVRLADPASVAASARMEDEVRRTVLKRIHGLRRYFTTTPVLEDQDSREIVFGLLDRQESLWTSEEIATLLATVETTGRVDDSN